VIDGSLRTAADTVGSELFSIVHAGTSAEGSRPSEARQEIQSQKFELTRSKPERFWLAALDDFRNWRIREAA
jgi:hypothetical protein